MKIQMALCRRSVIVGIDVTQPLFPSYQTRFGMTDYYLSITLVNIQSTFTITNCRDSLLNSKHSYAYQLSGNNNSHLQQRNIQNKLTSPFCR